MKTLSTVKASRHCRVKSAEVRYKPWGTTRYTTGTSPTTFQFTGQRLESSFGLYFYGARWYDSYLNRWIQPDTIIPDTNNSQSYDRYAYVQNNPLKYIDPFGNRSCTAEEAATGDETCEQNYPENDVDYILHLVIMDQIFIPDYLGQWPDPNSSASGGSGEPHRYSRVPGDENQIDIFIWLSYKEYKDQSVSPYEIMVNNYSKDTSVYLYSITIKPSVPSTQWISIPLSQSNPEPLYICPMEYSIRPQNPPYLASIKPGQSQSVSLAVPYSETTSQYYYPHIYGVFTVNITMYYLLNSYRSSSSYTIQQSWLR
jgi:RHS repeat-associated protein